ncbi:MAG: hypothetical protein ABIQ08_01825 [Duganella sp.]
MINSFTGKGGPAARDFQYRQCAGIFTAIVLAAVIPAGNVGKSFRPCRRQMIYSAVATDAPVALKVCQQQERRFQKQKRQPVWVGALLAMFLVARGGIEPPTQGFSKQGSVTPVNTRLGRSAKYRA